MPFTALASKNAKWDKYIKSALAKSSRSKYISTLEETKCKSTVNLSYKGVFAMAPESGRLGGIQWWIDLITFFATGSDVADEHSVNLLITYLFPTCKII